MLSAEGEQRQCSLWNGHSCPLPLTLTLLLILTLPLQLLLTFALASDPSPSLTALSTAPIPATCDLPSVSAVCPSARQSPATHPFPVQTGA
jgi:hypothetical protein